MRLASNQRDRLLVGLGLLLVNLHSSAMSLCRHDQVWIASCLFGAIIAQPIATVADVLLLVNCQPYALATPEFSVQFSCARTASRVTPMGREFFMRLLITAHMGEDAARFVRGLCSCVDWERRKEIRSSGIHCG